LRHASFGNQHQAETRGKIPQILAVDRGTASHAWNLAYSACHANLSGIPMQLVVRADALEAYDRMRIRTVSLAAPCMFTPDM
jgi:hypothetical protein